MTGVVNEVPLAHIDLKRAIEKYKNWAYIIFHKEPVFQMIVDVCESFEKGKISFKVPEQEWERSKKS